MKLFLLPFLALMACGPPPQSSSSPSPSAGDWMHDKRQPATTNQPITAAAPVGEADPAKQAVEIFATRCTPCHGVRGAGDGPASAGLTPKPANLTDSEWQKKVTDEHIENVISYGGLAVGKSAAMPPNPDLTAKPEIIKALRAHVRGFGAK